MRCRSCGFENMKTSKVCARCGARLVWEGAVDKKDFQPQLGGRKKESTWVPIRVRVFFVEARGVFLRIWRALGVFGRVPKANRNAAMLSIIPGLGHAYLRQFRRGALFFGAWVFFLYIYWLLVQTRINEEETTLLSIYHYLSFLIVSMPLYCCMRAILDVVRLADFCYDRTDVLVFHIGVSLAAFSVYYVFMNGLMG